MSISRVIDRIWTPAFMQPKHTMVGRHHVTIDRQIGVKSVDRCDGKGLCNRLKDQTGCLDLYQCPSCGQTIDTANVTLSDKRKVQPCA